MSRNYDQKYITTYRASYPGHANGGHRSHSVRSETGHGPSGSNPTGRNGVATAALNTGTRTATRPDTEFSWSTKSTYRPEGLHSRQSTRYQSNVTFCDTRRSTRLPDHSDTSRNVKREEKGYKTGHGHTGLDNLGNTCVMNCVLQVLVHTKKLREYFLDGKFNKDLKGRHGSLAEEIAHVMIEIWSGSHYSFVPKDIKRFIDRKEPRFGGHAQQDAQEFMAYVLEELHKELNATERTPNKRLERRDDTNLEQYDKEWLAHLESNDSIVSQLFEGQLEATTACQTCLKGNIRFDPFTFLQLPLTGNTRQRETAYRRSGAESQLVDSDRLTGVAETTISLDECFKLYVQREMLFVEDTWYCKRCKSYQVASLQMFVRILPSILIIQLKRFSMQGRVKHKNRRSVRFPLRDLDISPLYACRDKTSLYDLYAVINHHGGTSGGHYTAYIRCPHDCNIPGCTSGWHLYDDNTVCSARETDVLSRSASSAYLLFYHAKD